MNRSQPQSMTALLLTAIVAIISVFSFSVRAQDTQNITSLQWSPDGNRIVAASNEGYLQIWDTVTGELLHEFRGHAGIVNTLSWSPDSIRFASASPEDRVARIWDTSTAEMIVELPGDGFYEGPAFIAWNPNGTMLVSVASVVDGSSPLHFWRVENDNFQSLPITANVSAYDIAWSPDGAKLAVANVIGIYIFDDFSSSSLEPHAIAPFHASLAWSPDGTKLAGVEVISGIVQVLDVNTGQILTSVQGPARTLEAGIASLTWTNDGATIIADEFDGTVQSWDAATGELLETLSLDRQGGKFLMSLSPFGGRLALGNAAPITDRESVQASEGVIQTLANGAIQIVVPAPSLERLRAIADACNAPATVERLLPTSDAAGQLSAFVSSVEALPENTIPPACAADLIAVAEALRSQ